MSVSDIELHADLRGAVKELCQHFPDSYWRDLDREQSYPEKFVKTLSDAGYLSALIPEDFGGSGLGIAEASICLLYTSPSPRDGLLSRMPSSA